MVVEEKYQLGSMPDDIEKGGKANCVLVIWHKKKFLTQKILYLLENFWNQIQITKKNYV